MKRGLQIGLFFLLALATSVNAQPVVGPTSDGLPQERISEPICFRLGQSAIDPAFEGNGVRLEHLITTLQRILSDSSYVLSRVVVTGMSSPDGREDVNLALARRRAQALADYIFKHTKLPTDKIEVVNGGENWAGLRAMIEASQMPYREAMLGFMDRYPNNRDERKHAMQYYADSKPWLWMYEHFFPTLRMGAGGPQSRPALSSLSRRNWDRLREIVISTGLEYDLKRKILDALDGEADAGRRLLCLRTLCPEALYDGLQGAITAGLLNEASVLSEDNWELLRESIDASDIPQREQLLSIIDNIPILQGRESLLRALDEGRPYGQMLDRFLPQLLLDNSPARSEKYSTETFSGTLGAKNWKLLREMIAQSDMPGKELTLALMNGSPDPATCEKLLNQIGKGDIYRYINKVFLPELLYGLSPAAQENWELLAAKVAGSDLPCRDEILDILATTPPGQQREQALRGLDRGESWRQLGDLLLPAVLTATETAAPNGSGVSIYYERPAMGNPRTVMLFQRKPVEPDSIPEPPSEVKSMEIVPIPAPVPIPAVTKAPRVKKTIDPILAVKSDLVLWGGVMPGFTMGTWTPNLAVEYYFARRWSAQAGYAYSNWNALGGGKGLYAVSAADVEMRRWFGRIGAFKGFYVGVYGNYGEYDVQEGTLNQTGSFWAAGIGAGYLLPFSARWAFEIEARGGYRSASNDLYDIVPEHYYYNLSESRGKFSPQVRLQFMYRFGKIRK